MDVALSSTEIELPELLRAAREFAGLSRSQLANLMKVSWETVRQAEQGRDPRYSTLVRYLQVLPFLSPRALLLGKAAAPPVASPSIWSCYRHHYGFVVRHQRHSLVVEGPGARRRIIESLGVRSVGGTLRDAVTRINLMRAVMTASTSTQVQLATDDEDLAKGTKLVEDDDVLHRFTFPEDLDDAGFDYRTESRCDWVEVEPALTAEPNREQREAETLAVDVDASLERLELVLQLPPGSGPPSVAPFAAPQVAVPPLGAFALARTLHPEGLATDWEPDTGRLRVVLDRPLPMLRHGLAWVAAGVDPPPGFQVLPESPARLALGSAVPESGLPEPTLAARITAAREHEGLSRRELATRMGVSPATVIAAESGRDPRCSTLKRLVEVLPETQPEDLFVLEADDELPVPPSEWAWLYYRNLIGLEVDESTRTLELEEDGSGEEIIGTRALRRRHGTGDLVVKDGISRAVHGQVGPVFVEQDGRATQEHLRIRWIRIPNEQPEFHLFVPAGLAESGVSFTRRETKERAYRMSTEHQRRSIGPAFECPAPVGRLVLTVKFPAGYWPQEVRTAVRAAVNISNPRWPDLSEALHEGNFKLRKYQKTGMVRLQVERPLLGFRYSISWQP
ncbi:MAG: helix-turn-helix domain-containing protein [Acidobacteriota bacterium]